MMDLVIMCGHMPHRRVVTAERYAAGLARAQMHPSGVRFYAFHANELFSGFDLGYCA